MIRRVLIIGLSLGLVGCPFSVNQLNRLPESQPLAQPVLFNQPGPLRHDPSGLVFPEWYEDFQRVTAYRYDTAGLNVGIGYNDRRPDCVIAATFYLYPAPRMSFAGASPDVVSSVERGWLDQEFARSRAEIDHYHPGMESPAVGASTTPAAGAVLHGPSLTYHEGGNISDLRLFVYRHQWFLKYRFTYPESCEAEAKSKLEALIPKLPWAAAQQAAEADGRRLQPCGLPCSIRSVVASRAAAA